MKTKKQVTEDYPDYKRLINAVIKRVGIDAVKDINNHGIQGGFNGFIYYSETVKFAKTYRKEIFNLLKMDAHMLGLELCDIPSMVAGFGYFRDRKMDDDDFTDLAMYIVLGKSKEHCIPNLMAWYAAETVCGWFED